MVNNSFDGMGTWSPTFDALARELGLTVSCVYGRVRRFCQGARGVCQASVDSIAYDLGLSHSTTRRHLAALCDAGYLVDLTPNLRNHPHTYKAVGDDKIRELVREEKARASVARIEETHSQNDIVALCQNAQAEDLLCQNEILLGQNDIAAMSKCASHVVKMTNKDTHVLRKNKEIERVSADQEIATGQAYADWEDIHGLLNPYQQEMLGDLMDEYDGRYDKTGGEWLCEAIRRAAESKPRPSIAYVRGVLRNMNERGWARDRPGRVASKPIKKSAFGAVMAPL